MAFAKAGLTTLLVPAVLAAGCALQFPPSAQSGVFACNTNKDCSGAYECISGKCTLSGSGQDGGTTDGGNNTCTRRLEVQPSVVPAGVAVPVVLSYTPSSATSGSTDTISAYTIDDVAQPTPTAGPADPKWNVAYASLPPGLTATTHNVAITLAGGCVATAQVTAVETANVKAAYTLATVTPQVISTADTSELAATWTGLPAPPPPAMQMYLVGPTGPSKKAIVPLDAVRPGPAASSLLGDVGVGLVPGSYDLVVVAGNGAGRAVGAIDVVKDPAPVIVSVAPYTLTPGTAVAIDLVGELLPTTNPQFTFDCKDGAGLHHTFSPALTSSGDANRMTVKFDLSAATPGSEPWLCNVTVRANATPSIEAVGGPISLRASGKLLGTFTNANVLPNAAGDPSAAVARLSNGDRYVAVVGFDGPVEHQVALARVGPEGLLPEGWHTVKSLPPAASNAGIRLVALDHYLMAIGGMNAGSPSKLVFRADVLDPTEAPTALSAFVSLDPAIPRGQQSYVYTVAPIFASTDPVNPGGTGMSAPPIAVTVPTSAAVVLSWAHVQGAVSYAVYRGMAGTNQRLGRLATVSVPQTPPPMLRYVDNGQDDAGLDLNDNPPTEGAIGAWAPLTPLSSPAADAAVALAPLLAQGSPPRYMLMVMGGFNGATDAQTVQYSVITPGPQGPMPGTWGALSSGLQTGRTGSTAFVVTKPDLPAASLTGPWVFAGPGTDGNGGELAWLSAGDPGATAPTPVAQATADTFSASSGAMSFVAGGRDAPSVVLVGDASFSTKLMSYALGAGTASGEPGVSGTGTLEGNVSTPTMGGSVATDGPFVYIVGGTGGSGSLAMVEVGIR